jgi:esterase/lipase superfamily enzyme
VSWGAGVIKYKGRSYAFKVNGLSVGAVGLTQASASGEVFNRKTLDDFNGNYVAVGAGLTVAGGGGAATMKNQNGVTIEVKATTRGAKVALGASGVGIELLKWRSPVMMRWAAVVPFVLVALVMAGCAEPTLLMPTPSLYARGNFDPYADVPPALRTSGVDVVYLTDREREASEPAGGVRYGHLRSRSVAFGIAHVEFGHGVSWDDLVQATRSSKRRTRLPMRVTSTTEMGRFSPTPKSLVEPPSSTSAATLLDPPPSPARAEADETLGRAEQVLSQQLAASPVKDVYLFVHGFNNDFYDSVTTIAELWHFFGRQGVPVAYSWPAGHTGWITAYHYDRESSEFTVYHLKQMIRRIAENPDVHRLHIIAHSRGTDVVLSALRELHLEISGSGRSTQDVLKLGTLVLAAPDLDFEVMVQRAITARLQFVPRRAIVYVCAKDDALSLSSWLFGGMMRLGKLQSRVFTAKELSAMRGKTSVEIIDARISEAGSFGHDYFHSSPAVSSDLVLVMRYDAAAGAENGRPLKIEDGEFWMVDDQYPTPATRPAPHAPSMSQVGE